MTLEYVYVGVEWSGVAAGRGGQQGGGTPSCGGLRVMIPRTRSPSGQEVAGGRKEGTAFY